jgi:hypothetical protein
MRMNTAGPRDAKSTVDLREPFVTDRSVRADGTLRHSDRPYGEYEVRFRFHALGRARNKFC